MNKLQGFVYFTVFLVLGCLILTGCADLEQNWSHTKSSWVGLERKITLYSNDGRVIREWNGRYNLEVNGSAARFINNGKAVHISGTFVIEEK